MLFQWQTVAQVRPTQGGVTSTQHAAIIREQHGSLGRTISLAHRIAQTAQFPYGLPLAVNAMSQTSAIPADSLDRAYLW
jgi:hypothetical protein